MQCALRAIAPTRAQRCLEYGRTAVVVLASLEKKSWRSIWRNFWAFFEGIEASVATRVT